MSNLTKSVVVMALSAALITLQILLTRIFSVVFLSHLGFVAISMGMLGLSAAGVRIYLAYGNTREEETPKLVADHCFAAALLTLVCVFALSRLGADPHAVSWRLFASLTVAYVACVGPFYTGGLALSLLLVKTDTRGFGKLYAFDLLGAGCGGLLALALLPLLGGPAAAIFVAIVVAGAGACVVTRASAERRNCLVALGACVLALGCDLSVGTFHLRHPKGLGTYDTQVFEKWNAFSRVAVYASSLRPWSLSPRYEGPIPEATLVDIDSSAATSVAQPSDAAQTRAMAYELTSLAYFAAEPGTALVIGAGGGRDVLSALLFGQKRVDAVEINPIIVNDVMLDKFTAASDNLYRDPRVSVHVQDGRSFVRGATSRYDVIQLSLVDTWAATVAGAFALAENNLYTREALADYVSHLQKDGVLTFARWSGFEVLRLIVELDEVCRELGIEDFARHLALLETVGSHGGAVTNVMFRRSAFDASALQRLDERVNAAGFTWLFDPRWSPQSIRSPLVKLLFSEDVSATFADLATPVEASTDDWPFFFLRPVPRVFGVMWEDPVGSLTHPFFILVWVTLLSSVAAVVAIAMPLLRRASSEVAAPSGALASAPYFALLGLGFMVTEVCLSQRFALYLGHPTYALTVVLTSLLLGAGAGSFVAAKLPAKARQNPVYLTALGLVISIVLLGSSYLHAMLFAHTGSFDIAVRVALSALSIAPVAVLLGMCLPTAIANLTEHSAELVPWAWGVNGFFSVLGSCVGALCATGFGFGFTSQISAGIYALWALTAPKHE